MWGATVSPNQSFALALLVGVATALAQLTSYRTQKQHERETDDKASADMVRAESDARVAFADQMAKDMKRCNNECDRLRGQVERQQGRIDELVDLTHAQAHQISDLKRQIEELLR